MKFQGSEDNFQIQIATCLDLLGVLWMHPANERRTSIQAGVRLKRKGVKSGVPDILIFEPRNGYAGLAIELKVGTNKASENQKRWQQELQKRNWKTLISNDIDAVINTIYSYLNLIPNS